ncbi:hypothetical protein [Acinetobacter chengduensis]|uniref:Uncharacterized protein n=1 Tax=Acinetobacter chengduensis TaxID=2420890 RepID=A0ABX9TTX1_9GAMM|nr:hypothetical protein [Acinetobacter chengduensis]RLL18970.1 hypothetical protein D9K81_14520 [Acinetobacter chengduensis]
MTVSKILQGQAGIQYGAVTDKSEADPRDSLNNVFFTGQFKRGRFDKPMKVHSGNVRAMLGYDPENMDYVAIEDALATGVPFVWVQRVAEAGGSCQPTELIVPVNNFSYDGLGGISVLAEFYVNGELKETKLNEWSPSDATRWWAYNSSTDMSRYNKDQVFLGDYFSGGYTFSLYSDHAFFTRLGYGADGSYKNYLDRYDGIPLNDGNFILLGYPDTPEEYEKITGNDWYPEYDILDKSKIDVKFKVNPNVKDGYIDLVKMLWGHDVSLHGCARYYNMAG